MKKNKIVGRMIIDAIDEALANPEKCRTLRPAVDVAAIRKQLHLTQKEFSAQYRINLETLKNWEQGKRTPDTTTMAYLMCIAKKPDIIQEVLNS